MQLFFPERCLLCRSVISSTSVPPLCARCAINFRPAGAVCLSCQTVSRKDGGSCKCRGSRFSMSGLMALCYYESHWRSLLHDLKYRQKRYLARPFGIWLAREITNQSFCSPHLVTSVPLHLNRYKERGFNQSALIARHSARILGTSYREILLRNRDTASQTTLSRRQRRENISGAFSCRDNLASGTIVLLIDDIYSTGATMLEAAKVIREGGAQVYGAVVAFNPGRTI